jgi:hypothetical protein
VSNLIRVPNKNRCSRNIWVPVGATLVGVEIKPNLAESKQSEDEKLQNIQQLEGIHKSKEQIQKHLKIQQRKSKQNQPRLQLAQYQLAGEMLAAALHNYQIQPRKTSYTIFGVRVIGMHSVPFSSLSHPFLVPFWSPFTLVLSLIAFLSSPFSHPLSLIPFLSSPFSHLLSLILFLIYLHL